MYEFLRQVWFDNTVLSYLVVLLVILFILVIKRFIAEYLAGVIFHFVKSVWQDVDKKTFTSLVAKPLAVFLVILVAITTLYRLRFPSVLNFDIYRVTLRELVHGVGSLILIVYFIRLLL